MRAVTRRSRAGVPIRLESRTSACRPSGVTQPCRRPGAIREIVDIDMPLENRQDHASALAEKQNHLWELLRDEARAADEELAHV